MNITKRKMVPIVRTKLLAGGSRVSKVIGNALPKTLPTAKVELTQKTVDDLVKVVSVLGSMYIVGGIIRILK